MLTSTIMLRGLCVTLLVIAGIAVAARVVAKETADGLRRVDIVRAFSELRQWAAHNGYTILLRQQGQDSPFGKGAGGPLVFHVVVQHKSGQRRWGWIRCGNRLESRWARAGSVIANGRLNTLLAGTYDTELDHESLPGSPCRPTHLRGSEHVYRING